MSDTKKKPNPNSDAAETAAQDELDALLGSDPDRDADNDLDAMLDTDSDAAPVPPAPTQPRASMDPMEAFAKHAAQGATMRWGDEASSALAGMAEAFRPAGDAEDESIPRTYAAGSRYRDMRNNMRSDLAASREQYKDAPWYADPTVMGEATGAVLTTAVPGMSEVTPAMYGAAAGLGGSDSEDARGMALDTAVGAGVGKAAGVLADTAGRAAGPAARWAWEKAGRNRVAAAGATGAQLERLAANRGNDYIPQLGEDIERLGMHKGVLPGTAERYLNAADAVSDRATRTLVDSEQAIQQQARPMVDVTPAVRRLEAEQTERSGLIHPDNRAESAKASQFADSLKQRSAVIGGEGDEAMMSFGQAMANKRDLYDRINFARRGGPQSGPYEEQLNRDIAGVLKEGGEQALDQAVQRGELDPMAVAAWKQSNKDFGTAQTVKDFAQGRTFRDAGNQAITLPGWLGGGMGAAAGGGPGGAVGVAAAQVARNRGRSIAAGGYRALQHGLEGIADVPTGVAAPLLEAQAADPTSSAQQAVRGFLSPAQAQAQDDGGQAMRALAQHARDEDERNRRAAATGSR